MIKASGKMAIFLFKVFNKLKLERTAGVGRKLVGDQYGLCIFLILDIIHLQTPHLFFTIFSFFLRS